MSTTFETPFLALASIAALPSERLSTWERLLLYSSTMSVAATIGAFAMAIRVSPSRFWNSITLVAGMVCMLLGMMLAMRGVFSAAAPLARFVANPAKTLLAELDGAFRRERSEVAQLAKRFEQDQLEHAHERLLLAVAQLRRRTSLTVGAIEKLGVVPGAVVGGYYLIQLVRNEQLQGTYLPWLFVSAAIVYGLAGRQSFFTFRLEQLALMLKRAADAAAKDRRTQSNGNLVISS
jgi:hypothetical protein